MSGSSAESESAAPSAEASGGNSGGGGNKLVAILTIVNFLITAGVAGLIFVQFKKEKAPATIEDIDAHGGGEHGGGEHAAAEGGEHGGGGGEHGAPAEGGHGEGGHGGGEKAADSKFGKMVPLEQFTVNLATPGSVNPRFVRVNISLEVPSSDTESEVTQKMPQIRNAIIDLFNSKRPSDLANAEGRDYLKEEIRNALNSFVVTGKVKGVYFTAFNVTS